ncbi:MAG: DMT family transporter [Bacteroidota bacterium]
MYFVLFLQQFLASMTHIVGKSITFEIPPATVLAYRAAIAAALYFVWIMIRRGKFLRIDLRDVPTLLIIALLNVPLNQFLFLTSVKLTSPPNVALAYALTPAFVLIIAIIFLKESSTPIKISGVVLAIMGAVFMIFERGINFGSDHFTGNVLVLIASMAWALYTVLGRDFSRKYGAFYTTGISLIVGFIIYFIIFQFLPYGWHFEDMTTTNWLQVFYLGAITSGLAHALWYWALTKLEASKVAVFNNLQPVFTTILSVIFFGTPITIPFLIGGAMIITGVVLTQRG